jgi:hypothetical protein
VTGEQLVEHDAQTINVAAMVYLFASGLLG